MVIVVLIRSNVTLMFNETSKSAEQNFCEELLFLCLHGNIKHDRKQTRKPVRKTKK